ncbi:hypothetical protein FL966_06025 [Caproiciproducens galactitolivorans]|uniref:Uncharacterized protein n=1 Tax=Caproiciproducens galactitolivorans TaxID=642589 RepID=A0A4Z0Y8M7_9FIRM|nr:hypothetical protein [Caproiciproducens galactitolivorans]QEY34646.1 hypothetical protein FL966_06025 [Caproiciproducens galactitolivorans]TGJ75310.1 hypothetical protein CAGA_25320 [Caproiciproducens galactitolivorans]
MTALIDVLIYLSIIGTAVLIFGTLLYGINRLIFKTHRMDADGARIHYNREYIRRRLGKAW